MSEAFPPPTGQTTHPTSTPDRYTFADFTIDVRARQLYRAGVRVPLTTKAFDVLLSLVRREGEIASKDTLISEVWRDTFVSEDSLTQNISLLRRLLDDDVAQPKFITTVARVGYRFIAPVSSASGEVTPPSETGMGRAIDSEAVPAPQALMAAAQRLRQPRMRWLYAMLVLTVGIGVGLMLASTDNASSPGERRFRFAPDLPKESTLASGGVVSPDGRHIAFIARDRPSGETRLWVRTLSTASTQAIPGSGGALHPFWSPDSRSIAFFGGHKLHRVMLGGGEPTVVCDTSLPRPPGGTWNERGDILFADGVGLSLVPAQGGEPRRIVRPSGERGEVLLRWPQFLPGGERFLYEVVSTTATVAGVYVGAFDGSPPTKLLDTGGDQVAYTRGDLLYLRDGRLFARGFNSESALFTGDPFVIVDSLPQNAGVSAATDAVIAFGGRGAEDLTEFDRNGRVVGTISGIPPLRNLTLSTDQRTLVGEGIRSGVWLVDLVRRVSTSVIEDGSFPLLLDDRSLAYSAGRQPGPLGVYVRDLETGSEELLLPGGIASDAFSGGQELAYVRVSATTRQDIWTVDRARSDLPRHLIASPAREIQPDISPDGRWIAYASNETGTFEVYVDAFPGLGQKTRVSPNGGTQPQWRGDGRELFYLGGDQTLMSVRVETAGGLKMALPLALFRPSLLGLMSDYRNQYVARPDGQAFFVGVASPSVREPITLIVNWRGSAE